LFPLTLEKFPLDIRNVIVYIKKVPKRVSKPLNIGLYQALKEKKERGKEA